MKETFIWRTSPKCSHPGWFYFDWIEWPHSTKSHPLPLPRGAKWKAITEVPRYGYTVTPPVVPR